MAIKTVICDVCGVVMLVAEASYDSGTGDFLCDEHYRQRRLEDAKAKRKELADWLEVTHLARLRELDEQIARLENSTR